jgi:hypothetical protein
MKNEQGVGEAILVALVGRPRNRRGSPPPFLAPLGPVGPSSATLPARGRVDSAAPTSPLAGEVAQLGPKDRSEARRGGEARPKPADRSE